MKYSYTARTNEGQLITGQLEAASESELASLLHSEGKILTHVEANTPEQAKRARFADWFRQLRGVSAVDKIFFTQNLQVMVRAGLSLAAALNTIAEQTRRRNFADIIRGLATKVERGIPMSDAMTQYPRVFPDLYVNMVRAGEKSGKLDEVLEQLTIQLRKNHSIVSKIRGAMTYPIIVVLAMIGIGTAMMIVVIPKISSVFEDANVALPLATRLLIGTSNFLVARGWWLLAGVVVVSAAFARLAHTRRGQRLWHGTVLRLPIVSPIVKKINLAKFSRTFSSLLKTDIPIANAFHITASTLGNALYRDAVEEASDRVKKGVAVATMLRDYPRLFPPLITQMTAVGEETGTLDTILNELASFYEEDVDRTMDNLATVIEPVLMLALGVGVGAMAVAIIMPMYSLTEAI